ncbi:hypothetical protein D0Z07_5739 [Hyphodiscus hymeniophilus]|uniref:Uncharacterized protein n=1 Tax=Hyphodiscus hymeniophilus TaxID=353542 RepID=A0A9P6VHZ5_9HELO|nr:hypothetical protein D0Z07_5739 [Hyphodiscus hymeniophilus]
MAKFSNSDNVHLSGPDDEKTQSSHVSAFQGWMAFDKFSIKDGLKLVTFQPKQWEETDIDVKVTHCGVDQLYILVA